MSKVNIVHLSWVMSTKTKGYGACVKTCNGIKATLSFFLLLLHTVCLCAYAYCFSKIALYNYKNLPDYPLSSSGIK